jgi:hypothetical protein
MSTCVDLRLYNKIGVRTEYTIPVDVSETPNNSLAGFIIYWSCKRTLTSPSSSITLNSYINTSQLYITDVSGSVKLILNSANTTNLPPGTYYWTIRLEQHSGSVRLTYPGVAYGDIIFQRSLEMGTPYDEVDMGQLYEYIEANTSGGDFTVNLPAVATRTGKFFVIKADSLINGVVIVVPYDSETIDDQSNYIMNAPYAALQLYSDGSKWTIVN